MNRNFAILLFSSLALLVLHAGCGDKSNLSGLVRCEGNVSFDGSSCAEAKITFSPIGDDASSRRSAVGTTDASGNFKMMTLQPNDGVYPGEYAVTITKIKFDATTQVIDDNPTEEPLAPKQENLLPAKYENKDTSGLTITVPASGIKDASFKLEK